MKSVDDEKKMQEQAQTADKKEDASSHVTKEEKKESDPSLEKKEVQENEAQEEASKTDEDEVQEPKESEPKEKGSKEKDPKEKEPKEKELKEKESKEKGSKENLKAKRKGKRNEEEVSKSEKTGEKKKPSETSTKKQGAKSALSGRRWKLRPLKVRKDVLRRLKLILLLCILILFVSLFTPLYKPKRIVILGNNELKEEEVVKMGKIPVDKSIYLLRSKQIEQNLCGDPYVKSAGVSKKFPNTLIVDMNMREEVATVNFQEGFVVIDYTGHILRIEQDVKKIVKPLITGLKEADMLKVGDRLEQAEKSNFQMILDLISNVQNAGLIHNISEMNLQDEENIFLITTQGLRVLLGRGDDLTYKLNQLSQILVDLHTKGINYGIIDMRYDSYPVYREN